MFCCLDRSVAFARAMASFIAMAELISKFALERRLMRKLTVQLALERRFVAPLNVKLALDRRLGCP